MTADPYLDLVHDAERRYQALIADPASTAYDVREAGYRASLTRRAYAALSSSNANSSNNATSARTPAEWRETIERQVARDLSAPGCAEQLDQIRTLGRAIVDNPELLKQGWLERARGPDQPWFYQSTPELQMALKRFDDELQDWARQHTADARFVGQTPQQVLREFILARPDPFIMLRLTQTMPWDVEQGIRGLPGFVTAAQRLERGLKQAHARGLDRSTLPPVYRDISSEAPMGFQPNYDAIDKFLGLDDGDKDKDKDKPPPSTAAPVEESYWKPKGTQAPLSVTILDTAFTCIPYVGNVYAGLEIISGYNAFGYPLTDADKAILAAAILIPYGVGLAKLAAKGSGAAVKIVGGGAEVISETAVKTATAGLGEAGAKELASAGGKATEATAKAATDATAESIAKTEAAAKMAAVGVEDAQKILLAAAEDIGRARQIPAARMQKVLQLLQAFVEAEPRIIGRLTPQAAKLFLEAALKHPQLQELSAGALSRIIAEYSAKSSTGVLGQLAEELFFKDFIAPLAGSSSKVLAHLFGVDLKLIAEGWELSFIPGHLIRDGAGKLTDMLLVATKKGEPVQRVLGVFEIKAYEGGAAELRGVLRTTAAGEAKTLAHLDAEVARTIAYRAQFEFEEGMAAVATHGAPHPPAVAEIEARLMDEYFRQSSQILHDVDRLGAGKVVSILIDGKPTQVVLDQAAKFFAVAPAEAVTMLKAGGEAAARPNAVIEAFEGAETLLMEGGHPTFFWALKVSRAELDVLVQVFMDIAATLGKL